MAWQPGQSGNPRGRPKKGRALTDILERMAYKRLVQPDGSKVNRIQLLSSRVWEGLTTGRIRFEDGDEITLGGDQYLRLVKMLYDQVDGPPRPDADGPLQVVTWSPEAWKAEVEKRRRDLVETLATFRDTDASLVEMSEADNA